MTIELFILKTLATVKEIHLRGKSKLPLMLYERTRDSRFSVSFSYCTFEPTGKIWKFNRFFFCSVRQTPIDRFNPMDSGDDQLINRVS